MISTKDAKNTTIIKAPNFAFKLNLHIQVDSRINWYIHVINTMWSTNIFQFFSASRIDNLEIWQWQILSKLSMESNKFFQPSALRHYNFEWDTASLENNFEPRQVLS